MSKTAFSIEAYCDDLGPEKVIHVYEPGSGLRAIPATPQAEAALHSRNVLVVPDFIANAGGVICAAIEVHGGSEFSVFEQIAQKIRRNTEAVLTRCRQEGIEPRQAAIDLARNRIREAMSLRRAF